MLSRRINIVKSGFSIDSLENIAIIRGRFALTHERITMNESRKKASDKAITEEIRLRLEKITGMTISSEMILGFIEDPDTFVPPTDLIERVYKHFSSLNPTYSRERALTFLRRPLSKQGQEDIERMILIRNRVKKSMKL